MNGEQITIRLGEDFNWWIAPSPEEPDQPQDNNGVLDPRQVRYLAQALEQYRGHGLRPALLAAAFKMFEVEAEVSEGLLRLASSEEKFSTEGPELFALPVTSDDGEGPYQDFLDAISEARVRHLNKTHHFARECSVMEMDEELAALDSDRYFCAERIHVFNEINEILEWSPAEWDDAQS